MRKKLFGVRPTNKVDVIVAAATALLGVFHAIGTYQEYKANQADEEENNS